MQMASDAEMALELSEMLDDVSSEEPSKNTEEKEKAHRRKHKKKHSSPSEESLVSLEPGKKPAAPAKE